MRRRRLLLFASIGAVLFTGTLLFVVLPKAADRLRGNNTLRFYGRVVDPSGQPMAGVKVTFQILHSDKVVVPVPFAGSEKSRSFITQTDVNGDFELPETTGYSFSITGMRSGRYELEYARGHQQSVFNSTSGLNRADAPGKRMIYQMKLPDRAINPPRRERR